MHNDVIEVDHRDIEAEKFVHRVVRHRRGGAQAEEEIFCLGEQVNRTIDCGNIQICLYCIQAGHDRFEDLAGIGIDAVVFLNVTVYVGRAVSQALGEVQFEIGKAFGIKAAAKRLTVGSLTSAMRASVAMLE